ncbi:MAG: RsmB/NOP family class I SAM-dependent RNA methyltransferase [Parvularculaceae bacterium]|nr:RsmB/NOP family class I SAM-dependent RNA methyltransferase [Parvularculaceae bacterium]
MRMAGRVAAAIVILEDFERRRVPLKTAIADWARGARYAGAKDRAAISGLCLDVLRRRRSLSAAMEDESARAAVLAHLRLYDGLKAASIAALAAEAPHGPGPLSEVELAGLQTLSLPFPQKTATEPVSVMADFPGWLESSVERAFGASAAAELVAFAARADIDLRLNTLKTSPDKALAALETVGAAPAPFVLTAARIAAPSSDERAPSVTVIPAFNKGWVEVQDLGSQLAAAAAGEIARAQVLDFCAGGGGKTLALGSLMGGTGQLYAYDNDARRLQPLYERARRAGVRNLQIVNPATDKAALGALEGRMDVVFVDAPCTGSGTWRRHPDTKWRLTPEQLARRVEEQDQALAEASRFVKRSGRLVYVTCSFLMEENEDRLALFAGARPDFSAVRTLDWMMASGLLREGAAEALAACETPTGALRLTPLRTRTDGFFIAVMQRR